MGAIGEWMNGINLSELIEHFGALYLCAEWMNGINLSQLIEHFGALYLGASGAAANTGAY